MNQLQMSQTMVSRIFFCFMIKNQFERKFLKPSEISERLKCPICLEVYLNPIRISCGHTLCQSCLERYIRSSSKCPECRAQIDENLLGIDVLATQIINELLVECPMMECPWKGEYQILKLHLDSECVFKDFIPPSNEHYFAPKSFVDERVQQKIKENTSKGTLTSRIAAYSSIYKNFVKKEEANKVPLKPKVIDLQKPDRGYHEYEFFDPNLIKFRPKSRIPKKKVRVYKTGEQYLGDLFRDI